jgi:hypothetical protein
MKNKFNLIYAYISFAFVAIVLDIFFLHPIPNLFALVWLLMAAYYIGKFSGSK